MKINSQDFMGCNGVFIGTQSPRQTQGKQAEIKAATKKSHPFSTPYL